MTKLALVTVPDKRLRQVSQPVAKWDKKARKLVLDMVEILEAQNDPSGIGLAAIQVGVAKRIFLMRPRNKIAVVINPVVVKVADGKKEDKRKILEGCLSLPGYYAAVRRGGKVRLKYQTVEVADLKKGEGELMEKMREFKGLAAKIVQHEMDHLEGKLFVDEAVRQKQKLYRLKGKEWEEVEI